MAGCANQTLISLIHTAWLGRQLEGWTGCLSSQVHQAEMCNQLVLGLKHAFIDVKQTSVMFLAYL